MPISISASSNFYRTILSAGIDSAIAGLTANDSTKKIFSTMTPNGICCNGDSSTDPVNPVFTRSATCWAKNIDTSPISPWNNGGGYPAPEHAGGFGGTGTLISPRHIVYCNHFQIKVGKKLIFVDMNNNCYIRTLSNSLQVGSTDIRIGLLDSDLPSSVSFCKVASFDLTTITDTNNRVAALYLDQERKALVGDYFNSDSAGSLNISTNSQRANFYELPIGGDSACPINFVYNNKIILLFLFTTTYGGESIPYNIAAINSVMTTLGGGYTLSLFNKKDIVSEQKNILIKKQNLNTLIPFQIGIDVYPNNLYTFKSATTNLLGTVFNPSLFNTPYIDIINITPPNEGQQTFLFDGSSTWVYGYDFITNANNYVIPNNSLVQIQTNDITSVPVGGGAIIQKYYGGKIQIEKSP